MGNRSRSNAGGVFHDKPQRNPLVDSAKQGSERPPGKLLPGGESAPEYHGPCGQAPVYGFDPWTLAVRDEMARLKEVPEVSFEKNGVRFFVHPCEHSLWTIAMTDKPGAIAFRMAYAPDVPLSLVKTTFDGDTVEFSLTSAYADVLTKLQVPDSDAALIRWTTSITPAADLILPDWPRDIYPLDADGSPLGARGTVHAAQRGAAAGLMYMTMNQPDTGTLLYLQNLTALNDYCERTHTVANTAVAGSWPQLGFQPPGFEEKALTAGEAVVISDAFVQITAESPADERAQAALFLRMLADIYRHLSCPVPEYHDWPAMARKSISDLATSPKCTVVYDGYVYLHPYTDSEYPDSMVQLTVLLPIMEFLEWGGLEDTGFVQQLRAGLGRFFDPTLKTVRRYLPSVGDDKDADEVDSWYLYHPLTNLARLAERGDAEARDLFLQSVDFGVRVAHHFSYQWPVQYKVTDFSVVKQNRKEGEKGQTDVPGLYAYVMLQAHQLTGDEKYIEEAKMALHALEGLCFSVGYQFNNTAWGALASYKLFKLTGERIYLDESYLFLASLLHNTVLWECEFGPAKHYPTFFALTCLHDGAYEAAYETFESFAAIDEYLRLAEADIPDWLELLLTEFYRHTLDRLWYTYPSELPEDILATDVRNGHIDRNLAIPLEDVYPEWEAPGAVGQEIHGCGAAFVMSTRAFRRILEMSALLFCEYPVRDLKVKGKSASFRVQGDPTCKCRLLLIPDGSGELGSLEVRLCSSDKALESEQSDAAAGAVQFWVQGGGSYTIDRNKPKTNGSHGSSGSRGKASRKPKEVAAASK